MPGKKRKDSEGRVLQKGESQRKNLTYQYRWTDALGRRNMVYATTLEALRKKERRVQLEEGLGLDYSARGITVVELVERYIELKRGMRYRTQVGYEYVLNLLKKEKFGHLKIRDVRISDAKLWIIRMAEAGKGYSTICSVRGVLKPAFQMAFEDDIIHKNPFDFRLDIIPNTSKKREAMTPEQQRAFMDFIREDDHFSRYYDEYVVLLETGMRVSELAGLTMRDLDFENRRIKVDHQLAKGKGGAYYVEKPKTENGVRFIPMTDRVYDSLRNILRRRKAPAVEAMVDGHSGILLLDSFGKPKVALHFQKQMKRALAKYNQTHEVPLPAITPHVFRHTFCTNMANAGMDVKSLQYLMGHSDVEVTLNVYTHASYEHAQESMAKIVRPDFGGSGAKVSGG